MPNDHDQYDCYDPHCPICGDRAKGFIDYLIESIAIALFFATLIAIISKSV